MIGNLSAIMVENKAKQKDISFWEDQVPTPRGPVTKFTSATLETLAKERQEMKGRGLLKKKKKKSNDNNTSSTITTEKRRNSIVATYNRTLKHRYRIKIMPTWR